MNEEDRQRKRALVVVQVVIYGYLATMFIVQLRLWSQRGW